jgi:hypothetical protein
VTDTAEGVLALVELTCGELVLNLPARHVSLLGAFVEIVPEEYPEIAPGAVCDLILVGMGEGDDDTEVRCRAVVIRREDAPPPGRPAGAGLLFDGLDEENAAALRELILRSSRALVAAPDA